MITRIKVYIILMVCGIAFSLFAQEAWIPAEGMWNVIGKDISQGDATSKLSRLDSKIVNGSTIELSFNVAYIAGGYRDEQMLSKGEYHAGFGIHLGVEDPLLRERSWGNGDSYLLWINLDTRSTTRTDMPEHYGLRAQVYKSNSPSSMNLIKSDMLAQDAALLSMSVDNYASIDIVKAIKKLSGVDMSIEDVIAYFAPGGVDVHLRANIRTGEIAVMDPTNSGMYFKFPLDPGVLSGDYISLRTNNVALNFSNVSVQ